MGEARPADVPGRVFYWAILLKRKFKYEFGRQVAKHGALPGDIEHSETRVFDTYDFMMRSLGEPDDLDDVPIMSRAGWD